jgi:hypothetical protein
MKTRFPFTFAPVAVLAGLLLQACADPSDLMPTAKAVPKTSAAPVARVEAHPGTVVYTGMCDASAVVMLDEQTFAIADDEDNILRVYSRAGGEPVYATNLSAFLGLGKKASEVDIEGTARIGETIYWISSHGTNAKGKEQDSRRRFFATTSSVSNGMIQMRPVGRPYYNLLQDLLREPKLARFNLATAAKLPPKSPGALNIEGLTETPDGHLLIGFRNPIPQGKSLLVPLLNPTELVQGKPALFGDPILIDLGGFGVRSITPWNDKYLIIAGSPDSGGQSRLYTWRGGTDQPEPLDRAELLGINPEAITVYTEDGKDRLWVVSDDGNVEINCAPCKELKNANQKRFRAVSVPLESTEISEIIAPLAAVRRR